MSCKRTVKALCNSQPSLDVVMTIQDQIPDHLQYMYPIHVHVQFKKKNHPSQTHHHPSQTHHPILFSFSKNNRNTMETQLKPASEHVRV